MTADPDRSSVSHLFVPVHAVVVSRCFPNEHFMLHVTCDSSPASTHVGSCVAPHIFTCCCHVSIVCQQKNVHVCPLFTCEPVVDVGPDRGARFILLLLCSVYVCCEGSDATGKPE